MSDKQITLDQLCIGKVSEVKDILKELVTAIETKWLTTTPPKELVIPLAKAKEILGG